MRNIPPHKIATSIRRRLERHISFATNALQEVIKAVICVFDEWTWRCSGHVEDPFVLAPVDFADEILSEICKLVKKHVGEKGVGTG